MSANRGAASTRTVDMAALTVVVPVWDRYVRWLDECVESILAQHAECDLRVLVLDNASTHPLPEQPPGIAQPRVQSLQPLALAKQGVVERCRRLLERRPALGVRCRP